MQWHSTLKAQYSPQPPANVCCLLCWFWWQTFDASFSRNTQQSGNPVLRKENRTSTTKCVAKHKVMSVFQAACAHTWRSHSQKMFSEVVAPGTALLWRTPAQGIPVAAETVGTLTNMMLTPINTRRQCNWQWQASHINNTDASRTATSTKA